VGVVPVVKNEFHEVHVRPPRVAARPSLVAVVRVSEKEKRYRNAKVVAKGFVIGSTTNGAEENSWEDRVK